MIDTKIIVSAGIGALVALLIYNLLLVKVLPSQNAEDDNFEQVSE